MSSDQFAIRVSGVQKCYQIYERPQDRLRQAIVPRLKKMLGRGSPDDVRRYYREFWALRDITFEVPRGGAVAIVGRNGSGKSTLLQIICGTLTPTAGSVEVNGRVAALLELGSGFNPEFTGRENVFLNAAILGLSREQVESRFDAICAFADIGEFIEQPVKSYSSGMVLRLAFAVIAHVDADILVIDEALAVGDAFFTQKCMRFLRKFMDTGTILFVSHDTGAVVGLCESAVWLDRGEKKLEGSAKEVASKYLEAVIESQQGESAAKLATTEAADGTPPIESRAPRRVTRFIDPMPVRDARMDKINDSRHRNDLELFSFDPSSSGFGLGGGRIVDVALFDDQGNQLSWIVGGETVSLRIDCQTSEALASPIIGFLIRDRLGQMLFGDNSYLSYQDRPLAVDADQSLTASFRFTMPILPVGDYSITVSLAEGTQQDHVQHHWIHDAVVFKSHSSSVSHGLVGIPMQDIRLEKGQK